MSKFGYLKMDKLKNFAPVYLINLKDHAHRLENAKEEFAKYGVKDYTVIEAIDGRNSDLSEIIDGKYPNLKSSEIGCLTSHIKALKHWLDTSDSEYAIIIEDDFSFDTVKYWNWDWDYVMQNIPKDAEIVQMIMIQNDPVKFHLHKKEKFNKRTISNYAWSTACYLIKRSYAKTIVNLHYIDGRYRLENYGYSNQAADVILYNLGVAYSMPLFTHILDMKNSINQQHGNFHMQSKNNIDSWWKNHSKNYKKDKFFDLKNGFASKASEQKGCFTIFHVEEDTPIMKKRNILTKRATEKLTKSFDPFETPTIIMKSVEDVKKFYKDSDIKIDPIGHFNTGWKPGELGIWASNYTAWKNFVDSDYDYIILMEDDIVLGNKFNEKLIHYMNELPQDWDIFTAYIPSFGNDRYNKNNKSLNIGKENICRVYQSWSCLCYVVSKQGAQKLLDQVKSSVKSPIDHYLFYNQNINAYTIKFEKGNICDIYTTESTVQNVQRYDMTGYV
jgi:GR25 family glycosyltransferase involved in LPS biosynthesis